MTAKKLLLPAMLLTVNLLHSNVVFSKDQFEEASKRAKLALEVCGNGHQATIEYGKVTACDGKPILAGAQNTKIADKAPTNKEQKKSSMECIVVDKYLYCNDENFYERVSPVVEVQLKKIAKGVVDRSRLAEKTVDHSISAVEKPNGGSEK